MRFGPHPGGRLHTHLSRLYGALEYWTKPSLGDALGGGPFNGQRQRQAMYLELQALLTPSCVIETGTYRGSTTAFLAKHCTGRVFSIEARPRFHQYARMRLRGIPEVTVHSGDSRRVLKLLAGQSEVSQSVTFFYLDAHWYADLPLPEEIAIIEAHWHTFAIMIDDFEVPGDPGYRFDDYGPEKQLTLRCLRPRERWNLTPFFPTVPSAEETGAKRGCVVLARGSVAHRLSEVRCLGQHQA